MSRKRHDKNIFPFINLQNIRKSQSGERVFPSFLLSANLVLPVTCWVEDGY